MISFATQLNENTDPFVCFKANIKLKALNLRPLHQILKANMKIHSSLRFSLSFFFFLKGKQKGLGGANARHGFCRSTIRLLRIPPVAQSAIFNGRNNYEYSCRTTVYKSNSSTYSYNKKKNSHVFFSCFSFQVMLQGLANG